MKKSANVQLPQLESVIRGKYRLRRLIGEGGMGVVYEADHLRLRQTVAIKVLQPSRSDERDAERFLREARAASQLKSHHVARVLDVDELPSGLPFLVMEYLEGCDVENELLNRGRLLIGEAVDYIIQACDAVADAHAKGIVHRDLKPSNLYLCERDDERVVKVLDFGISKMADEASVTLTATSLGTPLYMSPEQIRDAKNVDHRSDIWSLGVILFELLTGQPPFEGQGGATAVSVAIAMDPPPWLSTLRTDVPPALERVVMTMLEKDREARFQSVAEVAEALRPFASDPELPGRVSTAQLPRALSTQPTPRVRRTASTVSGGRVDSVWTTASGQPRKSRFVLYAISAAAFVLGGGLSAAIMGPVLLRQPRQTAGTPAVAKPQIDQDVQVTVASASTETIRVAPDVSGSASATTPNRSSSKVRVPAPVRSSAEEAPTPAPSVTTDRPRTSPKNNPIRL